MSPGGRRVSWLFFKARAKRPYLDSYGSSEMLPLNTVCLRNFELVSNK